MRTKLSILFWIIQSPQIFTGHVRLVSSDMPKDENDPNKVESAMFLYK